MDEDEVVDYELELEDGTKLKSSREFTGKAKATYPLRGETYVGDFKDGVRHGNGKYTYGHGDIYEGEFRENLKHGIGKLIYQEKGEEGAVTEKGIYHGYFESGVRHGEGVFITAMLKVGHSLLDGFNLSVSRVSSNGQVFDHGS